MENLRNEASEAANYVGKKVEESGSQWADILKQVVDKLTGKNMEVTYNFQNFEIDLPVSSAQSNGTTRRTRSAPCVMSNCGSTHRPNCSDLS